MRRLIAGVRCVEFGVTDLARATDFYERVWTLRSVERKPNRVPAGPRQLSSHTHSAPIPCARDTSPRF